MTTQPTEIHSAQQQTYSDPWRELALIAYVGMEICWIVPWFRLLTGVSQGTSALGSFVYFGGAIYASLQLARINRRFSLKKRLYRIATFLLLIGSMLIGFEVLIPPEDHLINGSTQNHFNIVNSGIWIPAELIIVIMVMLVWRHGTNLAREWIGPLLVMRGFKLGLAMLLIYGVIGLELPTVDLDMLLFAFILASLAAMTCARIGGLSKLIGGQRISLDWQRFGGVFLAIAGAMGIVVAVVAVLGSRRTINFLANLFSGIFEFIAQAFVLILFPIYFLLIELIEGLFAWMHLAVPELPQIPTATPTPLPSNLPEDAVLEFQPGLFEQNPLILNFIVWGGLLIGLVIILFVLRSRTRWADEREFDDGDSETILQKGDLFKWLRRSWGGSRKAVMDRLSALNGLGRRRAAARIRQIYQDLLVLSQRLGQPRASSTTPLEYLPVLEGLFPNNGTDLRVITDAYVRIRYGELPESRLEVDAVELAWKRLSDEGDAQLRGINID